MLFPEIVLEMSTSEYSDVAASNRPTSLGSAGAKITSSLPAVDAPVDYGNNAADIAGDSLWWRHEALHRRVMMNPGELSPLYRTELLDTESRWLADPPAPADAFAESNALLAQWTEAVAREPVADIRPIWTRRYWRERNRRANLAI